MRIFRRWIEFLSLQTRAPEDSLHFRGAVAVNVVVALVSVAKPLEWPWFSGVGIAATLLAMALSYRNRRRNNWDIKALLSVFMVLALGNFLMGLSLNPSDPRLPLAELLVWLQTLHSFDLPGRRDLNYSLLVALILMSIAGVLSVTGSYAYFLAIYALTAMYALQLNYRRALVEATGQEPPAQPGSASAAGWARMAFAALLVLLFMPRFQSFRIRALPMSLKVHGSLPRGSRKVMNASYPNTIDPKEFRKQAKLSSDSYAGFNAIVDLQLRGTLSSEVVLRVRSSRSTYLRGIAFDRYDGQFWTQSSGDARKVACANPPMSFSTDFSPRLPQAAGPSSQYTRENVQIVYVEKELPNLVMASAEPSLLYFPSDEVYRDSEGCILSPYPLESGTVYSVISYEVREVPQILKKLGPRDSRIRLKRAKYLQLPEGYSEKVQQFARQICEGAPTPYLKVQALISHLRQSYRYRLDVPKFPEDRDIVEYFLFEQKEGYCEHFATALAMMTRSIGLPSRYVTGFLPGSYNPLSGYHEVRANDAHAWVEVWIPNYGWLPFDATPAGEQRLSDEKDSEQSRSLAITLLRFLAERLGPEGIRAVATLLVVSALGMLSWSWWTRRRVARRERHFLETAAAWLGPPERGETARQWASRLGLPALSRLVELHEEERYGGQFLSHEARSEVKRSLAELEDYSKKRRRGSR